MKEFKDENGGTWVASAARENTERHHGVWYLIFHPAGDASNPLAVDEVRWQTEATAARTLRTMSEFELRRRLKSAIARNEPGEGPTPVEGEGRPARERPNVNAG